MWAVTKILQKVVTSANQVLRKSLMSRNIWILSDLGPTSVCMHNLILLIGSCVQPLVPPNPNIGQGMNVVQSSGLNRGFGVGGEYYLYLTTERKPASETLYVLSISNAVDSVIF
jgi:hypothetical protein